MLLLKGIWWSFYKGKIPFKNDQSFSFVYVVNIDFHSNELLSLRRISFDDSVGQVDMMRPFLIDREESKFKFRCIVEGLFLSGLVWMRLGHSPQDSGWVGLCPSGAASGLSLVVVWEMTLSD